MQYYQGIYLVLEKPRPGPNRIPIDTSAESGSPSNSVITPASFILKYDRLNFNDTPIYTNRSDYVLEYPEPKRYTPGQRKYVQKFISDIEKAIIRNDGSVEFLLDLDSLIDSFIIQEFAKNVAAFRLSTYFYKSIEDSLLYSGPIWDMDQTFGGTSSSDGNTTDGLHIVYSHAYSWWVRELFSNRDFANKVADRFAHLTVQPGGILSNDYIQGLITEKVGELAEARARHFAKWPVLGLTIWPQTYYTPTNFEEEIQYLRDWIAARSEYLSTAMIEFTSGTSTCGNGIVEVAEQCDGGSCCDPVTCRFYSKGHSCGEGSSCGVGYCTGSSATCPSRNGCSSEDSSSNNDGETINNGGGSHSTDTSADDLDTEDTPHSLASILSQSVGTLLLAALIVIAASFI